MKKKSNIDAFPFDLGGFILVVLTFLIGIAIGVARKCQEEQKIVYLEGHTEDEILIEKK